MAKLERDFVLKQIREYYKELDKRSNASDGTEGNLRFACERMLTALADEINRTVIAEAMAKAVNGTNKNVRYDCKITNSSGTFLFGIWEAKDAKDDLSKELKKKKQAGYQSDNMIIENTETLILVRNESVIAEVKMRNENSLADILIDFVEYEPKEYEDYTDSLNRFLASVPHNAKLIRTTFHNKYNEGLEDEKSEKDNKTTKDKTNKAKEATNEFRVAVNEFLSFLHENINSSLTLSSVYDILCQQILMHGIISTLYHDYEFEHNNIYKMMKDLLHKSFTTNEFDDIKLRIQKLTKGVTNSLVNIDDLNERNKYLIVIFEKFYKAYNELGADKNGIIYTPKEVSQFMVHSVDVLLSKYFTVEKDGVKSKAQIYSDNIEIIDPCTGTGNFIKTIIDYVPTQHLKNMYEGRVKEIKDSNGKVIEKKQVYGLWAIELDLMAYYIANVVIEGAYFEKYKRHVAMPRMVLADTLKLNKDKGGSVFKFFDDENAEKANEIAEKDFMVVIGNPPYNANQGNENNNNRNNIYEDIDERIKETYQKLSNAKKTQLQDPYTRFIRWSSDKINKKSGGMVAFITNRSYIEKNNMDGVRKSLQKEFDYIYIVDLKGDVRTNPKIAGTTHNIFGIQTGVAICFLIKLDENNKNKPEKCEIFYTTVENDFMLKEKRLAMLSEAGDILKLSLNNIAYDEAKGAWINQGEDDFIEYMPMFDKNGTKFEANPHQIFKMNSNGVKSNRDNWVYDFDKNRLATKMQYFINEYNEKRIAFHKLDEDKRKHLAKKENYHELHNFTGTKIKWEQFLRDEMIRNKEVLFDKNKIIECLYRPFVKTFLYYEVDIKLINSIYQTPKIYGKNTEKENIAINLLGNSIRLPFGTLITDKIVDLGLFRDGTFSFPLYYYDENGERIDNITDWALAEFRTHYKNDKIEKVDLFYYVYAVLHRKDYLTKYKSNLFTEFPRIPYYKNFDELSKLGKELADLHINYEKLEPTKLTHGIFDGKTAKTYTYDKANNVVIINQNLTLTGLPKECLEFTLGNKNAIEWVLYVHKSSLFATDADLPLHALRSHTAATATHASSLSPATQSSSQSSHSASPHAPANAVAGASHASLATPYPEYTPNNTELITLIERLATLSVAHINHVTQINTLD